MPGRNGTGPLGQGPMTGRRMGFCAGNTQPFIGNGWNRGCIFGRGWRFSAPSVEINTEILQSQKAALEEQLKAIDDQLSKR
ncbi:MAG: DUF5320 domain-containing protein [Sphaerochaeta sp.]